jgi:DNA-binding transcriptional ArsR family regulator
VPSPRKTQARAVYGEKTASMLVTPIPASILRHVAERERSLGELARELGLSKSRIGYHLAQLEKAGLIKKTREEIFHGGIRKFYQSTSSLQLPHLGDLPGAEREAQLLPIKTFLWGYLLGKFEPVRWTPEKVATARFDEYALEIAEALEQSIARGDQVDKENGELLYLKLLLRIAKEHLAKRQAEVNELVGRSAASRRT